MDLELRTVETGQYRGDRPTAYLMTTHIASLTSWKRCRAEESDGEHARTMKNKHAQSIEEVFSFSIDGRSFQRMCRNAAVFNDIWTGRAVELTSLDCNTI